jgi:hypothetical protein
MTRRLAWDFRGMLPRKTRGGMDAQIICSSVRDWHSRYARESRIILSIDELEAKK